MELSLQDLTTLFPNLLWLQCGNTQAYAELTAPQCYSNETARHNAMLNVRCLSAFVDWARENLELSDTPVLWPSEAGLPEIWELVNGTALILNQTRLVLIPSDAMDTEGFAVPQEWVDIPNWSADYYLPMQVNLEENWVCAWGYIAHPQLKGRGQYDPIYRTYSLDRDWVMPDLEMFWQSQNIATREPMAVELANPFTQSQIDGWIQSVSQPSPYSPRLDLDFEQWAALLERSDLRQKLYRLRLENAASSVQLPYINAGLWLRDKIDEFAQGLSWVLLPAFTPDLGLMRSPFPELAGLIRQLQDTGVAIAETARGAYQDVQLENHVIRCYGIVWTFLNSDRVPQWYLLLVLTPQAGATLPSGIKLTVRDETQVLVERSLEGQNLNQSLFAGVSGAWEETFEVAIALVNGVTFTLPTFGFNPESS
jgi:hypothetical protein